MDVQTLRQKIILRRNEWKKTQDDFMRPVYTEVGNHLRTLQNSGLTVGQLAAYWGTQDRGTVYRFLKYATIPLLEEPKEAKEPSTIKNLQAYLQQVEHPNHTLIKTIAPVPPEVWPHQLNPDLNWPTEPWEGEAEWDEYGILTTPQGMPLHLSQKTLGGIDKLLAGV